MQLHISKTHLSTLKLLIINAFWQSYGTVHSVQQGEPSSAGDEQGVEGLLTWCSVQMSPRRQNLTGGQFVIESIEHLQDVRFSCATTGQM